MGSKINRKARINRHLRIFKENLGNKQRVQKSFHNYTYNGVLIILIFLIPIYPTLAGFVYKNTQYDFYRGDIDKESILSSYYSDSEGQPSEETPILESADSFISVNTILNDERDLSGTNEIVDYEVKPGESFSSIAYKFKVSTSSIYWANNFSKGHVLQPGDILKIPPVSGLIHQVKSGDTIASIAKEYDVDQDKIIEQNLLSLEDSLGTGEVLVIPGAIKKAPKPVYKKPTTSVYTKSNTTTNTQGGGYSFAQYASSQYTTNQGSYKLERHPPKAGVAGNCTWYVAQYKEVDWRGNANQWIRNAKAKGHATGNAPKVGAIVQFSGRGYNPRYGHVAIVMDVKSDHLIVSDMNYRRLYEVTYRKVPINDRSIDGYIYVN